MNKVERLVIAGDIAPVLRDVRRTRTIKTLDADGNIKRVISDAELVESLLARSKIELAVTEVKRPDFVFCLECGKPQKVAPLGAVPLRHDRCADINRRRKYRASERGIQTRRRERIRAGIDPDRPRRIKCVDCNDEISVNARGAVPKLCASCRNKLNNKMRSERRRLLKTDVRWQKKNDHKTNTTARAVSDETSP